MNYLNIPDYSYLLLFLIATLDKIYTNDCVRYGYMTLPGPSVPGRQFLDRHSNPNPNPNPIPNPVQELTVQELT